MFCGNGGSQLTLRFSKIDNLRLLVFVEQLLMSHRMPLNDLERCFDTQFFHATVDYLYIVSYLSALGYKRQTKCRDEEKIPQFTGHTFSGR